MLLKLIKRIIHKPEVKLLPYTGFVVATRSKNHCKGTKMLMRIPIGSAIPSGTTLGKGTIIDIVV